MGYQQVKIFNVEYSIFLYIYKIENYEIILNFVLNSYSEEGRILNNSVCHINGLMRIKLLPDSSKLIICTTSGFILLINNLELQTLAADIQGFKVIFIFKYIYFLSILIK